MGRQLASDMKRITETPRTFRNWPEVLVAIASSRVGRGPATLTFRTRSGHSITVPNEKGAFVPTYEVFAEDCYDLAWLLGGVTDDTFHVLDVGAHVGTFSCSLATARPGATIDCFEPASDTAGYLRRNVEDNGLSARIRVYEKAVASTSGFATLETRGAASGLNSIAVAGAPGGTANTVETVSFDEIVAAAPAPVRIVKMDCEGGEYDAVYGSSPESWRTVDRMVLEYHVVPGQTWPELRSWLEGVGLHVVRDDPGSPGLGVAWLARRP